MVPFTNIEAVIFDMDGTLIEHTCTREHLTQTWFARFRDRLSNSVNHEKFFEVFWPKAVDMWHMMADRVIDGDTAQRYGYLNTLRFFEIDEAETLAREMVVVWNELVLEETVAFSDTYQVLQKLRSQVTTGILTNGFISLQRAKLAHHRLSEAVDFSLVSEEAGYHKPDPRVFEAVLDRLGNPDPARVIYVGDNPINDIEGALNVGIQPIFMNPRKRKLSMSGVVEIQTLSMLFDLLNITA